MNNEITLELFPEGTIEAHTEITEYLKGITPTKELAITSNGTYNVIDYASANVNVPQKQLGTKTITANGIYKAIDDNLDGYSEVDVETSGVDINDYFVTTIDDTNGRAFFRDIKFLKKQRNTFMRYILK